jgi:malonyl CoA-acyl carrier protein transacylase
VAFLFPGEASQYAGMLRGLEERFESTRNVLQLCREATVALERKQDSVLPFLLHESTSNDRNDGGAVAQSDNYSSSLYAVLIANWVLHDIAIEVGIAPDVMAGHSAGEFSVLTLSGVMQSQDDLYQLVMSLDAMTGGDRQSPEAGLLAVGANARRVHELIEQFLRESDHGPQALCVAMDNCPHQSIVVGIPAAVDALEVHLRERRLICEKLSIMRPYHTPLFGPFMQPMREAVERIPFEAPRMPIYSATTAAPFPSDVDAIRELAIAHWAAPVRFTEMIQRMYNDGVRVFVEAGPRGNLHSFVQDILRGKPCLSVAMNVMNRSPLVQINHMVAQLAAHHVRFDFLKFVGASAHPATAPTPRAPLSDAIRAPQDLPSRVRPIGVMQDFQRVMSGFLDVQQDIMRQYFVRRGYPDLAGDSGHASMNFPRYREAALLDTIVDPHCVTEESPIMKRSSRPHPLLGDVVTHDPGRQISTHRTLDLRQDIYAPDHAVGGQDVSEVDLDQCGLPVVPMTFTLETMGALARQLFPAKVVVRIEDVRLHRWLAYYEHDPVTVQMVATRLDDDRRDANAAADCRRVRVEIRDRGNRETAHEGSKLTAVADVILADHYPDPPRSSINLTDIAPSRLTLERLYQNLFHGRRFQGVVSLDGFGPMVSCGTIESLTPRDLFAFDDSPEFFHDPVMLDVAMHIMAGWHLEHEDQTGRLTLPFKLDSIEFFRDGPTPKEQFSVRTKTTRETSRQFCHDLDIITSSGLLYARYQGIRLWRFYLPVGEVNFHGPKNIYYLSEVSEPEASVPISDQKTCTVRLIPPNDLTQPALMWAASRVILSRRELDDYVQLRLADAEKIEWLFARAAMKDAVRKLWERVHGRRLFAADVELRGDGTENFLAAPRDGFLTETFPRVRYHREGETLWATASLD